MPISIPSTTLEKFTTFGDLLRYLRRRVGLNQIELANAVGYSNTQISRLEQNLRLPDISVIQSRFISALGLEDEPKVVTRLLDLANNVRREDGPGLGLCPYKGLNYFDENDADLFVGRETLTSRLVEQVLSLSGSVQEMRLLAIVGASGSGKSSLVRAGLVPALRWNKETVDWHIHILTPTAHPLESLATTLTHETNPVMATTKLMEDLGHDPHSLQVFANEKISLENEARLLVVVDQFEELFALCHSEEERAAFIDNLLTAASEKNGPVMIVIALRADFYAACAEYPQLREALTNYQEYIGAMNDDEVRRAIEEPAERGRWELEQGLVNVLLHDVGHEPGALPLLSHALFETWQRRRGRIMTLSGYASSGGVRGAIAETAEAVFTDQFTGDQRSIARKIFLRLTELGDETSVANTRRRATFNELILKPEEASTTHAVLKALADARLIITGEDSAEVAHEALIREWPRLREWLSEDREGIILHRHLTEAAQTWELFERDRGSLYRGARLVQANEWFVRNPNALNTQERLFLETSNRQVRREQEEREEQRERELSSAKELAETQRQSASRLRTRNYVITTVGTIAIILAMVAGMFGFRAENEKQLAIARELAVMAVNNLEIDPERSMLLSLHSLRTAYTRDAERALHQAIQSSRVRMTLTGHTGGIRSVEYSPDGNTIASASSAGEVIVWETNNGQKLFILPGTIARYSPDGTRLAIGSEDGTVTIWDSANQTKLNTFKGHSNRINEAHFSPDGKFLVSSSQDETFVVWDTETGQKKFTSRVRLPFLGSGFWFPHNVSFSPDGRLLISIDITETGSKINFWGVNHEWALLRQQPSAELMVFSPDGRWLVQPGAESDEIILWDLSNANLRYTDLSTRKPFVVPSAQRDLNSKYAFTRDGSMLTSFNQDGTANVWRLSAEGAELLMTLSGHTKELTDAAFHPDGTRLATASQDGTVRVWDITPRGTSEWFALDAHREDILRLSLTQDGKYLATASTDGVAKVWHLEAGKELLTLTRHGGPLFGVAISPDGTLLATAGFDNIANIWKLDLSLEPATAELLYTLKGHSGAPHVGGIFPGLTSVVFSPDGTKLATGGVDGIAKIWNVSTGEELFSVEAHPAHKGITRLAFSPDGQLLATASDGLDALAKTWNIANHTEISTFSGHLSTDSIWGTAFSPDGKRLATGSGAGSLKVWDPKTGAEMLDLVGHSSIVVGIDFSPDGKYLVTSSIDGTARIWDTFTGEELILYTSPRGAFYDAKFTPDGKRIIVSGAGYVYGYIFDLDETIRLARSRLTRWFTLEECRKYLHREECPTP